MRIDIAEQWAERLENGGYLQGKGRLRRKQDVGPDEYCCLGVLCELAAEQGVIEPGILEPYANNYFFGSDKNSVSLPAAVMEWSGIKHGYGILATPIEEDGDLAGLNDDGYSFVQIAAIILEQAADL